MRLSFDDGESFKETVESLRFNDPSSDPNSQQQSGSSNSLSMPLQESEWSEDNITPNDLTTLRRVGSGSILSIRETRRSGDI